MGTVGVVLPAFKQPNLLLEALTDVLNQKTSFELSIVIADDCCSFEETSRMSASLALLDTRVHICSRESNGGLSANRNTGIDFLIAAYPDLEAVTFLDADDRLDAGALQSFYDNLIDAPEPAPGKKVGWVYTDPYQFGGLYSYLKKPNLYSPLWHLLANANSATSLISISMLRAGCRFDETMRRGSEDWDFWLQGIRNNFYGRFVRPPTFRYRRRPESMTSDATLYNSSIRDYVAQRNADIYSERYVQFVAARDAARYALFDASNPGQPQLRYFVNRAGQLPDGFNFFERSLSPDKRNRVSFSPSIIVVEAIRNGTSTFHQGIRDDIFATAERALAKHSIVIVRRGEDRQNNYLIEKSRSLSVSALLRERNQVHLIFIDADIFVKLSDPAERDMPAAVLELSVNPNLLSATAGRRECEIALSNIIERASEAGLSRRDAFSYNPEWVPKGVTSKTLVNFLTDANVVSASLIDRPHAVLALDPRLLTLPVQRMHLEKVAAELRTNAFLTVIARADLINGEVLSAATALGDRLISLPPDSIGIGGASSHYMGAPINAKMISGFDTVCAGAMLGADVLVIAGFAEMISTAFLRRKKGTKVYAVEISGSYSNQQDSTVQPLLGLVVGYEHALDRYFAVDPRQLAVAAGRGIPREKISLLAEFGTFALEIFEPKKGAV